MVYFLFYVWCQCLDNRLCRCAIYNFIHYTLSTMFTDIFAECNGHAEYQSIDKELRDLQDAIKSVRESTTPLKLYKIAAPDTQ